jgi:release factor glutamine methyltransferase
MPPNLSIQEIYQELKKTLVTSEAEQEARIILEHVLNLEPQELITHGNNAITKSQAKKIYEIRDKRNTQKIPLAYLLEEAPFWKLKFFVNSDVLIPRPETELLVKIVLDEIKNRKIHHPTILDLCTGSGCIAVALKTSLPSAKIYASDISKNALNVAGINARRYNADIEFVLGDYLDPFLGKTQSPIAIPVMHGKPPYFDVIVSNPPYVSAEDYAKLEPELYHEPKHALVGFPYKLIARDIKPLLKPGGFFACEFGQGQENQLSVIFPKAKFHKDLEGNFRFCVTN